MSRSQRRQGLLPVVPEEARAQNVGHCPFSSASGCGEVRRCPMAPRRYHTSAVLCEGGAVAKHVWYLRHGTVALFREAGDDRGEALPWVVRKPGALIGEEAIVQARFTDTAVALTPVATCVGRRDDVLEWVEEGAAARVVMELVIRARIETPPKPSTTDGSAPRRVARWLAEEAREGIAPPMPRRVLAGLLGMKPETLSRALASLARAGAVLVTRGEVRVLDAARLRDEAGR